MTTDTAKVDFNKRSVEKKYREILDEDFSIELCEGVIHVHTSLPLEVEVPYSHVNEKAETYNLLALLADRFDFSYTVEFNSLSDLREWHDNNYNPHP